MMSEQSWSREPQPGARGERSRAHGCQEGHGTVGSQTQTTTGVWKGEVTGHIGAVSTWHRPCAEQQKRPLQVARAASDSGFPPLPVFLHLP